MAGAVLRGHQVLNLQLLFGGERQKLIGRLQHLQIADSALACVDQ